MIYGKKHRRFAEEKSGRITGVAEWQDNGSFVNRSLHREGFFSPL
jgi:hypothetical protein